MVTFDSQGGSAVDSQMVNHGEKATNPTAPTKTGYTFSGWYEEPGCTNRWDFDSATVTSDLTLYAKWTANPTYILTMEVNPTGGGTTNPAVGVHPGYEENQVVSITAIPATDRNFLNWSGALTGSVNPTTVTMNAHKTVTANFELAVGDSYGGGIVAYILQNGDPGYDANVQHGLIAATADQSTGIQWWNGSYVVTGATATAIGTGQANTTTIVEKQGAGSYAAKLCHDLTVGGYNDWFLPSKDELNKLYLNKVAIGGFADFNYWSSSEYDADYAWGQYFNFGDQNGYRKDNTPIRVRAVRAF